MTAKRDPFPGPVSFLFRFPYCGSAKALPRAIRQDVRRYLTAIYVRNDTALLLRGAVPLGFYHKATADGYSLYLARRNIQRRYVVQILRQHDEVGQLAWT